MERLEAMDPRAFAEAMMKDCRETMEKVAHVVNAAPDGALINGSDMACRDLLNDFRQRVYEAAVQSRVIATEKAAAFSPSAQN